MSFCNCRCRCALGAVGAGIILGVVAAFLQITGTITVTAVFLWAALGLAVGYLAVLLATACGRCDGACLCQSVTVTLAGILGSALFALVLLAVGITATSVVSAILVGLLVLSLTLLVGGAACTVHSTLGCGNERR